MTKTTLQSIKDRYSASNFDPNATISNAEITQLVEYAAQAPSAYNIQHWQFIAIKDKDMKNKLMQTAYGQQKVGDASVAFVVLGDILAHKNLQDAFAPMVNNGHISQEIVDGIVNSSNGSYDNNEVARRDEAIRSASLASMCLMLAADAMGFISGPMIGFDPNAVKQLLGLGDNLVPVMMIVVGKPNANKQGKKPRYSTERILKII